MEEDSQNKKQVREVKRETQLQGPVEKMHNYAGLTGMFLFHKSDTPKLENIHYDIIHMIFELLGPVSTTCLGLTGPRMYHMLKNYYPDPIPLDCEEWLPSLQKRTLGRALISWKGLRGYRLSARPVHAFLNTKIYGHYTGYEENALKDRFWDYKLSRGFCQWRCEILRQLNHVDPGGVVIRQLPSPHGMGHDWYRAAFKVIEKSLRYIDDFEGWMSWWGDLEIFMEHQGHWGRFATRYEAQKALENGGSAAAEVDEECECWVCAGTF